MKAMVLAAGMGTRLGELTRTTPKCLVRVGGQTLLEHVVDRLKRAGVDSLIINLHHLAEQVEAFIRSRNDFGLQVELSYETELLGTGAGLYKVADLLRGEPSFLVHNADIFSELDLRDMVSFHERHDAMATLAVMERATQRYFVFDEDDRLLGWRNEKDGRENLVRPGAHRLLAFSGIQVLSPRVFRYMENQGRSFALTGPYLAAAAAGESLQAYRMDGVYWMDAGTPSRLVELESHLRAGGVVSVD